MMVQWPVARFWVPLSGWHVLPMSARVLSRVSCPIVQSPVVEGQVRWHRRFSCEALLLWLCDGFVTSRLSHASDVDEWTRSCNADGRDERKQLLRISAARWQQTPHNDSPTLFLRYVFIF